MNYPHSNVAVDNLNKLDRPHVQLATMNDGVTGKQLGGIRHWPTKLTLSACVLFMPLCDVKLVASVHKGGKQNMIAVLHGLFSVFS